MSFISNTIILIIIASGGAFSASASQQDGFLEMCQDPTSPDVKKTVDFLLEYVEEADCTNGYNALKSLKKIETWEAVGISNLRPVAFFPQLEELHLANSGQLNDISPLGHLKNLRKLNLHAGGQINDGSALSGLTELVDLDLSGNQITDISFIGSLNNLKHLNFAENRIADVSHITNLPALESLFLYNQIGAIPESPSPLRDISALKSLTKLKTLAIRSNSIDDFSVIYQLKGLSELQAVDIPANVNVSELIASHPNLQKLSLGGGEITNVRDVGVLGDLYWLSLEGDFVGNKELNDILVHDLPKLAVLGLSETNVTDISSLEGRNFNMLFLSHNKIVDISPVQAMTELVWLMADDNQIKDLSLLRHLVSVQFAAFSNNPIIGDEEHCPIDTEAQWLNSFCKYYLEANDS